MTLVLSVAPFAGNIAELPAEVEEILPPFTVPFTPKERTGTLLDDYARGPAIIVVCINKTSKNNKWEESVVENDNLAKFQRHLIGKISLC